MIKTFIYEKRADLTQDTMDHKVEKAGKKK